METLYKAYKGKVQFFLVYTREVHPSGKKSPPGKKGKPSSGKRPTRSRGGPSITQHTSIKERVIAADKCMKGLKLTLPFLLDTMDNAFTKAYGGIPAGTAVVDINGKIAYWNRGAANGCRPKKAEEAIKKLLANGGGAIPEKWAPAQHEATKGKATRTPAKAAKGKVAD